MVSSQCVSIGVLQYFSADQNICHLVALHGYGFSLYIYIYALVFYHSLIPYKYVTLAAKICFLISMLSMMFYQIFLWGKDNCHIGCTNMISPQCVSRGVIPAFDSK